MSKDYNLFLKNPDNISAKDFELYAFSIGLQIRMYPMSDYISHSGFLPFNLRSDFIDYISDSDSFISGFEVYFDKYDPNDFDAEFNRKISGTQYTLLICLDGADSFEELIAYVFAGYLCKYCGGVLYDPQEDKIYSDMTSIEAAIDSEKTFLTESAKKNRLCTHPFTGWK